MRITRALSGHASPGLAGFWLFSFPFIIYQPNISSRAAYAQYRYTTLTQCTQILLNQIMKVKRQKILPGSILEIHANNLHFYAQILHRKECAFFDFQCTDPIEDISILVSKNVLFILRVYDDVITKGRWLKIGKLEVREDLKIAPNKFIQDQLNPEKLRLYNPNAGEIIPSNKQAVKGLECAAVWEAEHVEERLLDHFEGRSNKWVEHLAIKKE